MIENDLASTTPIYGNTLIYLFKIGLNLKKLGVSV